MTPLQVVISPRLLRQMIEHARRESPHEACGLLLGDRDHILEVVPARNELADHSRYRIDPRDHFAAIRQARARTWAVMGAFHSHPRSAPLPSETDREEAWPDFLYVIVSLDPACESEPVRAWQLVDGTFQPVALVIGSGEGVPPCDAIPNGSGFGRS
ncbi:MAG: M67 family metallopeptidase [Vicinamibacterales bacterium]